MTEEREDLDHEILEQFRETRKRVQDHWQPIYARRKERKNFTLLGKQISGKDKIRYKWKNPKEPNLLLTYVNHEANKTLQTDYLGRVTPNGLGANELEARVRQSVLRGVQRKANSTSVFNCVRRDQVACAIGYALVKMDYAGKRGFGKVLKDEYLQNAEDVFPDENANEVTLRDMKYFLIRKLVPKSEWKAETGEEPNGWNGAEKKALWYYWVREDINDTEYLLNSGETSLRSRMVGEEDEDPDLSAVKTDEGGSPLSRPTTDYKWKSYNIPEEGDRIIDREEWPGSYSPLVACVCRKVTDGEKVFYQSLTEFAEEAQTMYTILENIIALRLSKSPFSRWKVAFESIDVEEFKKLRQASVVGDLDVLFKSFTQDGKSIPSPEEIEPHVLDAILIQLQEFQRQKMQRIFGIFDANLGEKSNEQSGVAIEARAKGGDISNYDSQYAYMEFVEQITRVKLDLIPKVLTPDQQLAFIDKTDTEAVNWLRQSGGMAVSPDEEYELSIEATPISNTDREEEARKLTELLKVAPVAAQNPKVVAIVAKSMPGRYANEFADALMGNDPEKDQLRQAAQEAAQKAQQYAQAVAGLKQSVAMLKQQIGLMKQAQAIESQSAEAGKSMEAIGMQLDSMEKALDRQVKQFEASTGRMDAETRRIAALGGLMKEPEAPDPGEGME